MSRVHAEVPAVTEGQSFPSGWDEALCRETVTPTRLLRPEPGEQKPRKLSVFVSGWEGMKCEYKESTTSHPGK